MEVIPKSRFQWISDADANQASFQTVRWEGAEGRHDDTVDLRAPAVAALVHFRLPWRPWCSGVSRAARLSVLG
jgi:hypothetical protein